MGINGILQEKNRAGTIETPVWQAPSDLTGRLVLRATMPQDELSNTSNGMIFGLYKSNDGENWVYDGGFRWVGGNIYAMNEETILTGPSYAVRGESIAGKYIKVIIELLQPQKLGFELETV